MDAKKPNQPEEEMWDVALARRLGGALQRASLHSSADCPDADLIAAYRERSLSPEETSQCQDHFARCTRCREILVTLAAVVGPSEASLQATPAPELAASSPASVGTPPRVSNARVAKRWDWRVRWLAPALGAAAVLAIWFAIRPPWGAGSKDTLVAQAPQNEAPQVQALSSPAGQAQALPPEPGAGRETAAPSSRTSEPSAAKKQIDSLSPNERSNLQASGAAAASANEPRADVNAEAASNALRDEKQKAAPADQTEQQSFKAAARPVPAAVAPQAASTTPNAAPSPQVPSAGQIAAANQLPRSTSQSVVVNEAAPQVQTQSNGGIESIPPGPGSDLTKRNNRTSLDLIPSNPQVFYFVQIDAPGTTVRWRAGSGGAIQRSTDSGRGWASQMSPSSQDWLAGAAVSTIVGWLVGRKATIARTIDGEHWLSVSPPAVAGTPPDWAGVTASDAQNATITSSDKRQFVTQDGGKTWQTK